jgi:hypothetical protein
MILMRITFKRRTMRTVAEEVKIVVEGLSFFYGQTQHYMIYPSKYLPDRLLPLSDHPVVENRLSCEHLTG